MHAALAHAHPRRRNGDERLRLGFEARQHAGEGGDGSGASSGRSATGGGAGRPGNGGDSGTAGGGADAGGAPGAGATAGSSGASGSGGSSGTNGDDPALLYLVSMDTSFEDAEAYTLGPFDVSTPDPSRTLFILVQSASNVTVVTERVRVNGDEATKLVAVGEDVEPSAPSALFMVPFPAGDQASVEVELSATVVRCAVSVFVAYDLKNTTGVDDSETLVAMGSGSMAVDVENEGYVIGALAMATDGDASASMSGLDGTVITQTLPEGTPTLVYAASSGSLAEGPLEVAIETAGTTFNFRALIASIH